MLRSTWDLIYAVRAVNRGPTPRIWRRTDQPCDKCGKVPCMCSGDTARYRRRAFHAKRRGRCVQCGEPAREDRTQCQRCADAHVKIGADWRARCVASGRCQRCPAPAVDGKTCCRRCLDKRAAEMRRRRVNARAAEKGRMLRSQNDRY